MTKNGRSSRDRFAACCRIIGTWFGSNTFFAIILGIFVAQALWIVWSGAFSMAYDEFFHLGIIQEYAKGWTPFIHQPAGPAVLGALERDPSFLYHYLMSFPYRIVIAVWHTFTAQVIALRVLNTGLFVFGLFLYRRLLVHTGLSRRVAHIILLFFTLIPTVLMVAVQINYDNLMFVASGAALLLAVDITHKLRQATAIPVMHSIFLIAVLMAGSIIKYAFLPLALAIGLFITVQVWLAFHRKQITWHATTSEWNKMARKPLGWVVLASFIAAAVLFGQRIGGNIILYHNPAPDCGVVLSKEACKAHAAYGRNEDYKANNFGALITKKDRRSYPKLWYKQMLVESFFAVGPRELTYPYGNPLPTAYTAGRFILAAMIALILFGALWLWRNPVWQLFILVVVLYTGVLFVRNYSEYVELGKPVAIHGRYVIYLMPLIAAMAAASVAKYVRSWGRYVIYGALTILLYMIIMGGGWLPFIIRSADTWMWPHAVRVNNTLRSWLWPYIPK